jgi:DNA-binding CsgD family transcriptional regulator
MLGTVPDAKLALKLDRTLFSIRNKRLEMRIPPAPSEKYKPWRIHEIALLGKLPDSEVAQLTGRSYSSVLSHRNTLKIAYINPRYRPWTSNELDLLHSDKSNRELARLTGRTESAIKNKRSRLER